MQKLISYFGNLLNKVLCIPIVYSRMIVCFLWIWFAIFVRAQKLDAQSCAARWGFWLTSSDGTFEHGLAQCGEMGMAMVPISIGDSPDDPVNPVLRYMAGRVAEECKQSEFWIDNGLYSSGLIISDMELVVGKYKALCYEPTIPHPTNVSPAQSIHVTTTVTKTSILTRLFDIDLTVTETKLPDPVTTIYTSTTETKTEWTTMTFSTPTTIRYANLFWETKSETETVSMTLTVGTSVTARTIHFTVTTSVIAVTYGVTTLTIKNQCPTVTPTTTEPTRESRPAIQGHKQLICQKFSSLSELKMCDSADDSTTGLVMISTPNDFATADCACAELGFKLADLSNPKVLQKARAMMRQCVDLPDQMAWVAKISSLDEFQVCMAISTNTSADGPVACIQELPFFCQS